MATIIVHCWNVVRKTSFLCVRYWMPFSICYILFINICNRITAFLLNKSLQYFLCQKKCTKKSFHRINRPLFLAEDMTFKIGSLFSFNMQNLLARYKSKTKCIIPIIHENTRTSMTSDLYEITGMQLKIISFFIRLFVL